MLAWDVFKVKASITDFWRVLFPLHLLFREIFEWPNECESALGLHSSQPLSKWKPKILCRRVPKVPFKSQVAFIYHKSNYICRTISPSPVHSELTLTCSSIYLWYSIFLWILLRHHVDCVSKRRLHLIIPAYTLRVRSTKWYIFKKHFLLSISE